MDTRTVCVSELIERKERYKIMHLPFGIRLWLDAV
jgi:hypothetical protein